MEIVFTLQGETVTGVEVRNADQDLAFAVALLDHLAGIGGFPPNNRALEHAIARHEIQE